jgi:hypothetical protein
MAAQKQIRTMKVVTFRPTVFSQFFAVRAFNYLPILAGALNQ